MNKVFKLVWSKTKQCYVVASEFAKSHSKVAASRVIGRTVLVGVLVCVVSCGAVMPVFAETHYTENYANSYNYAVLNSNYSNYNSEAGGNYSFVTTILGVHKTTGEISVFRFSGELNATGDNDANKLMTANNNPTSDVYLDKMDLGSSSLSIDEIMSQINAGNGVTINGKTISAKAGNGITVGSGGIAAKAGTNVTVNGNGINVTGNGTVASGNTGLIDGGKLYTEVRPSDNGNYEEYFSTLL